MEWQNNYRKAHNIFAANGILFNHESPIRGETFVTRKITRAVARIKLGLQDVLYLGNLESKRDWGFAGDFIEAMWLMLQQDEPEDFVIATGQSHTVREFVEKAFEAADREIIWSGSGIREVGSDKATGEALIKIDPRYFRPTEVDYLLGDPSKAKNKLGWNPKIAFEELVKIMVKEDLEEAEKDAFTRKKGFKTYNHFE